jgi:hypothetical protein
MKVEKKVSVLGEWAKVKVDIFNGDLITIASEGEKVTGEFGERNVFKVETKNGIKNLSFNQTSINYLVDAFGEETNEWQGEKVKVWLVKSNVGGKLRDIVYLTAPDWVEGEEGFCPPAGSVKISKEEMPIIEEENIDVKDIPF